MILNIIHRKAQLRGGCSASLALFWDPKNRFTIFQDLRMVFSQRI